MATYDELKEELLEIGKILEKFPDDVKGKVFDLLVNEFLGRDKGSLPPSSKGKVAKGKEEKKQMGNGKKQKRSSSKESYTIDRNLNLRGDKSIPPFKDFFEEKKPKSAREINTVSVYYLKKMLGMPTVTLDHVYTCYDEVKQKQPKAFRQSFIDTKNKQGWLEFDSDGNIDIPHRGIVFVEHDLPKSTKA